MEAGRGAKLYQNMCLIGRLRCAIWQVWRGAYVRLWYRSLSNCVFEGIEQILGLGRIKCEFWKYL